MRILNLGAGVQSTTLALMGVKNWEYWSCSESLPYLPVGLIDHAIFADTQDEPPAVYAHLEWLKQHCEKWFPIHVRSAGNLGNNLLRGISESGYRFVSIPAFTAEVEGGRSGMTKRQCTSEYKTDLIERTIRREILGLAPGKPVPKDWNVHQVVGLSYDEAGRIARVKGRFIWTVSFPLFEMEMTRGGCKTWLKKQNIPHEVPRSACVYCPYHTDAEWREIKNDSVSWARVIEIDRGIRDHDLTCTRGLNQKLYLHSSCLPIDQVDFSTPDEKDLKRGQHLMGFLQECEGMCGV